ncbi:probable polygalacturonase [Triticum aestivum]|uniref:probable polygalacturonase n=1 Tax=Triticum aestivum TaxID=4565 RepID=UPI001D02CA64|nr:probable polygalacturonase [Triticum aestivum]
MASGGDGSVRPCTGERPGEGEETRERERGAGRRCNVQGVRGDEREKQEVAGDVAAGERARDTQSPNLHLLLSQLRHKCLHHLFCLCSNVLIRNLTILAPHDSPNTDGIDPDSSSNVCIEDCNISTGDDLIAIKSGWDEYGIAYGRPSSGITIRRITGSSPFAGFSVGSETSGGVEDVLAEHLNFYSSGFGVHIKTNSGRGGFIRNITVSDVILDNVRYGLRIAGDVGGHPDERYDHNALPKVDSLTIKNVQGQNIKEAGLIKGIPNSAFSWICLSNIKLHGSAPVRPWKCAAGHAFESGTAGSQNRLDEAGRIDTKITKGAVRAPVTCV